MERRRRSERRSDRRDDGRSVRRDDRRGERRGEKVKRQSPPRRGMSNRPRTEDLARRTPDRRRPEDLARRPRRRSPAEVRRMRKKRRRLRMIPVLLILLLSVYLVHAYVDQTKRIAALRKEKAILAGAQVDLENEVKSLEYDYENRDSFEFIEKVAREKLGMVKSNEEVYVDINLRDASDPSRKNRKTNEEKRENTEKKENKDPNAENDENEHAEPGEEKTGGGE